MWAEAQCAEGEHVGWSDGLGRHRTDPKPMRQMLRVVVRAAMAWGYTSFRLRLLLRDEQRRAAAKIWTRRGNPTHFPAGLTLELSRAELRAAQWGKCDAEGEHRRLERRVGRRLHFRWLAAASSSLAMSSWRFRRAAVMGVSPSGFLIVGFAPALSNSRTISKWPAAAAAPKGVRLSQHLHSSQGLWVRSTFTISTCPALAARNKGEGLSAAGAQREPTSSEASASTGVPRLRSFCTRDRSPRSAASASDE